MVVSSSLITHKAGSTSVTAGAALTGSSAVTDAGASVGAFCAATGAAHANAHVAVAANNDFKLIRILILL